MEIKHFIINNKLLIEKYEKLHEEEINIEQIKKKLINDDYFNDVKLVDLFRFRIFLDNCILLFNNEKTKENRFINLLIENYTNILNGNIFNNNDSVQKLENNIRKDIEVCKNIKDDSFIGKNSEITIKELFEKLEEKREEFIYMNENLIKEEIVKKLKSIFDDKLTSIEIDKLITSYLENFRLNDKFQKLRNSIAHMQYGNVVFHNNRLIFFGMYNKDRNNLKSQLIIHQESFHHFVATLFSNDIELGLPYKLSRIYTLKNNKKRFLEIKYRIEPETNIQEMKIKMEELYRSKDRIEDLKNCTNGNSRYFIKNEKGGEDITELYTEKRILKLCKKNNINKNDLDGVIKFYKDIESELSNLLVYISKLNDCIIEYFQNDKSEAHLGNLSELKMNDILPFTFKLMILYLKSINVLNRLEDDELEKNINKINTKGFRLKTFKSYLKLLIQKIKNKKVDTFRKYLKCLKREHKKRTHMKKYVLMKFRNSLAHGKINIEIDKKGEIVFIFCDDYNEDKEIIEISAKSLENFVLQRELYEGLEGNYIEMTHENEIKEIQKIRDKFREVKNLTGKFHFWCLMENVLSYRLLEDRSVVLFFSKEEAEETAENDFKKNCAKSFPKQMEKTDFERLERSINNKAINEKIGIKLEECVYNLTIEEVKEILQNE